MARDAIPPFLDQLEALPRDIDSLDLLIVSAGGDPTVAWRIVSLIRERTDHFSVLIPQAAYSAATLIALGADEIVMHANGNLGPVDPQIQVSRPSPDDQSRIMQFGSEELRAYLEFTKNTVGLSDQSQLAKVFDSFCQEVGPVQIGVAARGAQLSLAMGEKLLRMHMVGDQAQQAPAIAEELNKNFFHHGYPVSRSEAREIGLKIAKPDLELEGLVWKTWASIEADLDLRLGFNPLECLRQDERCRPLFEPVPVANIPSDLPPEIQHQAYQQVLQGLAVQKVPPVEYRTVRAIIESPRHLSHYVQEGLIFGARTANLQIMYNELRAVLGWRTVDAPPGETEE